jgi:RepB DNA-primase from phage plasmid
MTSNIDDTRKFLAALTGSAETRITIQIIPEAKGCKVPPAVLHGTLTELWDTLEIANFQGACVSVVPNETDFGGRRESNMVRARALWVDWDHGETPVTYQSLAKVLPPTITVQSARGQHNYYVLDGGADINAWRPAQRKLARALGTDMAVSDPSRAMRLPGFLHRKGAPLLVTLVQANDRHYTLDEIAAAFPAPPEKKRASDIDEEEAARRLAATSPAERFRQARYYIEEQAPTAIDGGGGRPITISVLCRLYGYGITEDEVRTLAERYNDSKCDGPWSERDLDRLLRWSEEWKRSSKSATSRSWRARGCAGFGLAIEFLADLASAVVEA